MKSVLFRLAKDSILKNKRLYFPFVLSATGIITLSYIVNSLAHNESLMTTYAGGYVSSFLNMGSFIIYVFALIFLFYTSSFINKKRKSEIGLYNVLGLSKGDLVKILLIEDLAIYLFVTFSGIVLGIIFEKLAFLIILKFLALEVIFGFDINLVTIIATFIYFGFIFFLLFVSGAFSIVKTDPIKLLKEKDSGEREPKAKWLITIIGLFFMIAGYYLANIEMNQFEALAVFFPAVFCVIIGTYLLFTSGSIAILKFLKNRPGFYYKTKHFITISHLMFRMKKNAAGLASISIMATMILVMTASTTSMWFSMESVTKRLYPKDYLIEVQGVDESQNENIIAIIDKSFGALDITPLDMTTFESATIYASVDSDHLTVDNAYDDSYDLSLITPFDLKMLNGEAVDLKEGEVIIYDEMGILKGEKLFIDDVAYTVKDKIKDNIDLLPDSNNVNNTGELAIVMTQSDLKKTAESGRIWRTYMFNIDKPLREDDYGYRYDHDFLNELYDAYPDSAISILSRAEFDKALRGMYSAFLFLGVFLGLTFMLSIVLIMYYKQISEGDQDREHYIIMQKVGLSDKEIQKTIASQVIFVFFAPLAVAIIHLAGSFKMVNILLMALSQIGTDMYLFTALVTTLAFIVFYIVVYILTSRTYYKIVTSRYRY